MKVSDGFAGKFAVKEILMSESFCAFAIIAGGDKNNKESGRIMGRLTIKSLPENEKCISPVRRMGMGL